MVVEVRWRRECQAPAKVTENTNLSGHDGALWNWQSDARVTHVLQLGQVG